MINSTAGPSSSPVSKSDEDFSSRGLITALINPMRDKEIDLPALERLVDWQIESGVDGLVVCGTTGETPTLSDEEIEAIITCVVKKTAGQVPVIAGTGSNNTARAISLTQMAAECGANATLQVVPFYNKPPQRSMVAHFEAVANQSALPIMLYNVPGRTQVNMSAETVAALAKHPRIYAIKEASADIDRYMDIIAACGSGIKQGPDRIEVLSGDDSYIMPMITMGGDGLVSVCANVVPGPMAKLVKAVMSGDMKTATRIHYQLLPLMRALFTDTNPIPIKYAMKKIGYGDGSLRLPLVPATDELKPIIDAAMQSVEK